MVSMRARREYALLVKIGLLVGITCQPGPFPARASNQASGAAAPTEATDKADFESVCGACHTSDMASDFRSAQEWKETIEKMVSRGAEGTDKDMEAVMRYLLRTLTQVNINTAAAEELPLVLDISEATAQAIVKYRNQHGDFKSLDDLKKVPGINAEKLNSRRDRVVF
jgi:competence protein ComEA